MNENEKVIIIVNGEEKSCDWKEALAVLREMRKKAEVELAADVANAKAKYSKICAEIDAQADIVIARIGNDAKKQWDYYMAEFKKFGKLINWVEYRWYYIAAMLILFGLFLHYVLGY